MLHLVVEADDSHAATMKSIVDLALLAHIYTLAGEVTAGERQLRHLAEAVEPVAEKHHGSPGGTVSARPPFLIIAVQTVNHNISYDLRGKILSLKEIAHRI